MKQDDRYTSEKWERSQQIADKYRKRASERSGESGSTARRSSSGSGRSSVSGSSRSGRSRRAAGSGRSRRSGMRTLSFRDVLAGILADRRFLLVFGVALALLLIFFLTRIFGGSGGDKTPTTVEETTTEEATEETTTEEETEEPLGSYAESGQPAVALTFDDGPSPGTTAEILDILEQYHVHATFFMIGQNVADNAALVKRMADLGCELGNHTWSNTRLTTMSASEREADFLKTNQTILEASGGTPVTVIRPPWGVTDKEIRDELQIPIIIWNVDTMDWENEDTDSTIQIVREDVKGGDIVLLHDTEQSTVEAMKVIVPMLLEQGYKLLTVSELYAYYGEELTLHLGHAYAEPQFSTVPESTAPAARAE